MLELHTNGIHFHSLEQGRHSVNDERGLAILTVHAELLLDGCPEMRQRDVLIDDQFQGTWLTIG